MPTTHSIRCWSLCIAGLGIRGFPTLHCWVVMTVQHAMLYRGMLKGICEGDGVPLWARFTQVSFPQSLERYQESAHCHTGHASPLLAFLHTPFLDEWSFAHAPLAFVSTMKFMIQTPQYLPTLGGKLRFPWNKNVFVVLMYFHSLFGHDSFFWARNPIMLKTWKTQNFSYQERKLWKTQNLYGDVAQITITFSL